MDSQATLTLMVGSAVLVILGVAVNMTVCVVMFRSKRIWKSLSSFLVLHLSIVDLVYRFVAGPLNFLRLVYLPRSDTNMAICETSNFTAVTCATATFVTLAAIALERYTNIAHPLKRLRKSHQKLSTILFVIWAYSLLLSGIIFVIQSATVVRTSSHAVNASSSYNFNLKEYMDCGTIEEHHSSSIITIILYFGFGILVPLVVMVTSHIKITKTLWKRSRNGTIHGTVARSVRKSLHMLIIVLCGFLISWVPAIVIRLILAFQSTPSVADMALLVICQLTQASSSVINLAIYAFYSKGFLNDCRKFCYCCSCMPAQL